MYHKFETLCEKKGITVYQACKEIGIKQSTISNVKNDIIANANYDINSDLSDMYKDAYKNGGEKQEKALRKKIDKMIKIIYKDNGKFIGNIEKGWRYYGFDSRGK